MYTCAGRIFETLEAACQYANFIARVSGFIVAVEKLEKGN